MVSICNINGQSSGSRILIVFFLENRCISTNYPVFNQSPCCFYLMDFSLLSRSCIGSQISLLFENISASNFELEFAIREDEKQAHPTAQILSRDELHVERSVVSRWQGVMESVEFTVLQTWHFRKTPKEVAVEALREEHRTQPDVLEVDCLEGSCEVHIEVRKMVDVNF